MQWVINFLGCTSYIISVEHFLPSLKNIVELASTDGHTSWFKSETNNEGRKGGRKEGKEKKGKERGAYLGPELAGAFECRTQSAKRDSRAAAQRKWRGTEEYLDFTPFTILLQKHVKERKRCLPRTRVGRNFRVWNLTELLSSHWLSRAAANCAKKVMRLYKAQCCYILNHDIYL